MGKSGLALALALIVLAGAASAAPASLCKDCRDCPPLVAVPAGTFVMGAGGGEPGRPEGPQRTITFARPFALGRFEVTNAQYAAFVTATGYAAGEGCRTLVNGAFANTDNHDWRDPGLGAATAPDQPVVCVSWRDAKAYVVWLSKRTGRPYRLPSEAEWEYAARAGSTGNYSWGEAEEDACVNANTYDADSAAAGLKFSWSPLACHDGAAYLAKVGSYRPNAFGLYDMIGNVWEWTEDCYVAPYPPTPVDGTAVEPANGGACERRAVRGGGWMTRVDRSRTSFRGRDPETARYAYFGFRVARDLDAK